MRLSIGFLKNEVRTSLVRILKTGLQRPISDVARDFAQNDRDGGGDRFLRG